MAVVIKNTFLDIAEYKFLFNGEPCGGGKRSCSVPREFKPTTPSNVAASNILSFDVSTPRSELSFHSAADSLEAPWSSSVMGRTSSGEADITSSFSKQFSCATPTSSLSSPRFDVEYAHEQMGCSTPTSSLGSPRFGIVCPGSLGSPRLAARAWQPALGSPRLAARALALEHSLIGQATTTGICGDASHVGVSLHYGTSCNHDSAEISAEVVYGTSKALNVSEIAGLDAESLRACWQTDETQEPENEPDILTDSYTVADNLETRTRLKVQAPVFQPTPKDTRMDAVLSCIRMVLESSGQVRNVKIEGGAMWMSSTVISAELHGGPHASAARAYDMTQLTKQALEGICVRLPTTTLLSARVQKEDCGYSLRSSVACLPAHATDSMCWDMFRRGHCPRKSQCRWYHPHDSDIARIKVNVRYPEDTTSVRSSFSEEQLEASSSAARHKISIGELVQ